jgi:hypothetical protein
MNYVVSAINTQEWGVFKDTMILMVAKFSDPFRANTYAAQLNQGEAMSAKTIFEDIFGFALLAGEQLAPIVVHNPRSQQFVTVLTPDVNALFQLLVSQGAMAQTTPGQMSATPTPPAA